MCSGRRGKGRSRPFLPPSPPPGFQPAAGQTAGQEGAGSQVDPDRLPTWLPPPFLRPAAFFTLGKEFLLGSIPGSHGPQALQVLETQVFLILKKNGGIVLLLRLVLLTV